MENWNVWRMLASVPCIAAIRNATSIPWLASLYYTQWGDVDALPEVVLQKYAPKTQADVAKTPSKYPTWHCCVVQILSDKQQTNIHVWPWAASAMYNVMPINGAELQIKQRLWYALFNYMAYACHLWPSRWRYASFPGILNLQRVQ